MKQIIKGFLLLTAFIFSGVPSFAHVSVKPAEVGVGERLNFTVSVPTEEADPTVQVRLLVPEGVQSVRPNAKPGWTIELKKSGTGEGATVTEIIWSGGSIPAEQRDEFVFSAQAPAKETSLIWKAYQTYEDGDVVAWETDPKTVQEYTKNNPPKEGEDDHNAPRPYSETKVVNDLKTDSEETVNTAGVKESSMAMTLSIVAVLLAAISVGMQLMGGKGKK